MSFTKFLTCHFFGLISILFMVDVSAESLTSQQILLLEQGEVLLIEENANNKKGQTLTAYVLVAADIPEVYAVLTDFLSYQEFMPNLEKVVVLAEDSDSTTLQYYLSLPLGIEKKYKLLLTHAGTKKSARINWKKLPWPGIEADSTIVATEGYWYISPFESQSNSMVLLKYHVYTDPGEVPFGLGWVVDYMSNHSVSEVMSNTRKRVAWYRKNKQK